MTDARTLSKSERRAAMPFTCEFVSHWLDVAKSFEAVENGYTYHWQNKRGVDVTGVYRSAHNAESAGAK